MSMDCTCGHEHTGCCAFDPPSAERPCGGVAVAALERKAPEPWRRLYCARHLVEHQGAAPYFELEVVPCG